VFGGAAFRGGGASSSSAAAAAAAAAAASAAAGAPAPPSFSPSLGHFPAGRLFSYVCGSLPAGVAPSLGLAAASAPALPYRRDVWTLVAWGGDLTGALKRAAGEAAAGRAELHQGALLAEGVDEDAAGGQARAATHFVAAAAPPVRVSAEALLAGCGGRLPDVWRSPAAAVAEAGGGGGGGCARVLPPRAAAVAPLPGVPPPRPRGDDARVAVRGAAG